MDLAGREVHIHEKAAFQFPARVPKLALVLGEQRWECSGDSIQRFRILGTDGIERRFQDIAPGLNRMSATEQADKPGRLLLDRVGVQLGLVAAEVRPDLENAIGEHLTPSPDLFLRPMIEYPEIL